LPRNASFALYRAEVMVSEAPLLLAGSSGVLLIDYPHSKKFLSNTDLPVCETRSLLLITSDKQKIGINLFLQEKDR
jgi:hypothetical protein